MDIEVLQTIIKRLERIENMIDARTQATHDRYAEIKTELGEIKTNVMKINTEQTDLQRRVTSLEENKVWSTRMILSTLFATLLSFASTIIINLIK